MQILYDEEKEALVVLIELKQLQQNVEVGITQPTASFSYLCYLRMIHNVRVIPFVVLVNDDGTIYPHSEFIEKVLLLDFKFLILVRADYIFWLVFTKGKFLAIHIFEKHLRKNKHAVFQQSIIVIPHIVNGDLAFHVLQSINAMKNVLHLGYVILIFFDEYSHL